MRVRLLRSLTGSYGHARRGAVIDMSDASAHQLIGRGLAMAELADLPRGHWHITCPVWGEPYRTIFERATVPAALAALDTAGLQATFHVFSDRPFAHDLFGGHAVVEKPVPLAGELRTGHANQYNCLTAAHRHVLRSVPMGDRVLLLNADTAVSVETIAVAEHHFAAGRRALVSLGVRALWNGEAPVGATATELLGWCWTNLHPILQDCRWGTGASSHPTTLIFEDGPNAQLHTFYLYPVALVKDRPFAGGRRTIDDDLILEYRPREYHVCGDYEIGIAELSGPERKVAAARPLSVEVMADVVRRCYRRRHLDSLRHGIRLSGKLPVPAAAATIEAIISRSGVTT